MNPPAQKPPGRRERERRLARLATRQHGVVARWQLPVLGFGEEAIGDRLADGRLSHIHREVYAVGHSRVSRWGRWWAGILAYGPGAVLSHRSAAVVWGVARQGRLVEVTAPRGRQGVDRRSRLWVHRCRLDKEDRMMHDGFPVTTLARTIFDFAETEPYELLKAAAEEADRLKLLRLPELEAVCGRGRGRRALRPVRRLLAEIAAPKEGRSPLEIRFHGFCERHHLPEPARNVLVLGHEVDALWPAAKLVIELDSWEHHGHRAAFERDRARDPVLLLAGYQTIRVTHRRLDREADVLAAQISALLRSPGDP